MAQSAFCLIPRGDTPDSSRMCVVLAIPTAYGDGADSGVHSLLPTCPRKARPKVWFVASNRYDAIAAGCIPIFISDLWEGAFAREVR